MPPDKKPDRNEILRLNHLLDQTLAQTDRDQLVRCTRILATMVASLKIRYQDDDKTLPETVKRLVNDMEKGESNDELDILLSRTIVECATALAVSATTKNILSQNSSPVAE